MRRLFSSLRPHSSYAVALMAVTLMGVRPSAAQTTAPSYYNAYSGTDVMAVPAAPALGPANSVISDPTFGSRVLRVTDGNTKGGESFISTDSGFSRTWNSDSTAIKLTGPSGDGYWLEFNPSTFKVGTGSSEPVVHPLSFGATWEWSAVQPNIIYYLSGSSIETYNTTTGASTPLASTPTGDPVTYMAAVIGLDNWVCAAAGAGAQDTYTKIFCVNPATPTIYKFIDVANATINGVAQTSPNWPTSAAGETIGIHDISGGTGPNWLEVTFHQQSWGANGGAVFNLSANTWSLVTNADPYWSGHVSMGNGKYENSSGSINGDDSRGIVLRDPDNLMNSSEYLFVMQPFAPWNSWCDADHSSWLNSLTNPKAPILDSRYSSCAFAWSDEIVAAAVDGSNTVWRFAHNFNGGSTCYYSEAFAQISNDGNWALFSSYWGATLGPDTSFGCTTRIDTFIVDLRDATGLPSSDSSGSASTGSATASSSGTTAPATPAAPTGLKSQTITFSPLNNAAVGAAPIAPQVWTSSGLVPTLASTTPTVCSVTGMTAFVLAAGTCSITATQAGNSVYAAATPVTQLFTVTSAAPAIPSPTLKGQTITFSALNNVAIGAGPIAPQVWTSSGLVPTLASTTPTVCSVSGMTAFVLAAGTCSITATQAGSSVYAPAAPVTQTFAVASAAPVPAPPTLKNQTITFSPLNNVAVGAGPIAPQVWTNSGLVPTLASTTPTVCSVSGMTAFVLAAGTCSMTATQAGNSVYAAAAPVTQSFAVTPNLTGAIRDTPVGRRAIDGDTTQLVAYNTGSSFNAPASDAIYAEGR